MSCCFLLIKLEENILSHLFSLLLVLALKNMEKRKESQERQLLFSCYNTIMETNYDFVAIGDTVVDAFIKLKKAEIIGEPDTPGYEIAIPFAEKVPYEDVFVIPAVGNAANAAVSAARLGLNTAIVTNLGDDRDGEDCLATLKKNNVRTDFVKINPGMKTNYHYVLWYGPERTILIKHQDYK